MTIARATDKQFDAVFAFLQRVEYLIEHGQLLDENDPDAEPIPIDDPGESFMALVKAWPAVSHCWKRVLLGGEAAIQNACDPNSNTLAWKPEILQVMIAAGLIEPPPP